MQNKKVTKSLVSDKKSPVSNKSKSNNSSGSGDNKDAKKPVKKDTKTTALLNIGLKTAKPKIQLTPPIKPKPQIITAPKPKPNQ